MMETFGRVARTVRTPARSEVCLGHFYFATLGHYHFALTLLFCSYITWKNICYTIIGFTEWLNLLLG